MTHPDATADNTKKQMDTNSDEETNKSLTSRTTITTSATAAENKEMCHHHQNQNNNQHHRHYHHHHDYKDPRRELHPSTAVIMAGYRSELSESAIKAPVFRSSTFEFTSAAAGELFFQRAYNLPGDDGQKPGLIYSRLNNPNTEILEDKMVALEKGSNYASAFPSGMSAISTTMMALVDIGGYILYVSDK
eukprot:scaffold1340_cov233-Amphora_coffeaeformis.AAC.7